MSSSLASPENLIEASVNVCNSTVVKSHSKNISSKKPAKKISPPKKNKKTHDSGKGTTNHSSMYFLLQNRDFPGKTLTRGFGPKSPTLQRCLFSGTSPRSTASFSKGLVSWSRTAMWASTPGAPKWWALEKVSPFKTWQVLVSIR